MGEHTREGGHHCSFDSEPAFFEEYMISQEIWIFMKGVSDFVKPSKTLSWTLSYAYFLWIFPSLLSMMDPPQRAAAGELSELPPECLQLSEGNEVTAPSVFLYSIYWQITNLVELTVSGLSNFKSKRIPLTVRLGVDRTMRSPKPQHFHLSTRGNFSGALEKLSLEHSCDKIKWFVGLHLLPKVIVWLWGNEKIL